MNKYIRNSALATVAVERGNAIGDRENVYEHAHYIEREGTDTATNK